MGGYDHEQGPSVGRYVIKDIPGKVQEEAGKLSGSKEQQIKGLSKQISGRAEKIYGDAQEAVEDATS